MWLFNKQKIDSTIVNKKIINNSTLVKNFSSSKNGNYYYCFVSINTNFKRKTKIQLMVVFCT